MDAIRAFIAIEMPAEVRAQLEKISQDLQSAILTAGGETTRHAVRWVAVNNIHLTLKFLGEVSVENLQTLTRMLKARINLCQPFEMQVGEVGAFPNMRRPRVLWVGCHAPSSLMTLQQTVESETHVLGYANEEREFSPHLTIGRITQNASPAQANAVAQALVGYQCNVRLPVQVKTIHLFRSDLQPSGAVYTRLESFPLKTQILQSI